MIKLKVTNVGNALGVVLPKAALERLHVVKGDFLTLSPGANGAHLLSPADGNIEADIEAGERIIQQFRNGLRALAKK